MQFDPISARSLKVRPDERLRDEYDQSQGREPNPHRARAAHPAHRHREVHDRERQDRISGNRVWTHAQREPPFHESPKCPPRNRRERNKNKGDPACRRPKTGRHSTLTYAVTATSFFTSACPGVVAVPYTNNTAPGLTSAKLPITTGVSSGK
jgi:hypothetical protein